MTSGTPANAKEVFLQALRFDFSHEVLVMHAHSTWSTGAGIVRTTRDDGVIGTMIPSGIPTPPTIVAALACEAFCIELYLKTIYCMEQQPFAWVHGLYDLFSGLPQQWKDRIGAHFDRELHHFMFDEMRTAPGCPKDIDTCLSQGSNAFQLWRYSFQHHPLSQFLAPARFALNKAIIQVEPEWEDLRRGLDTPPTPQAQ